MPSKLFGTDGIRGQANREPITPETTLKIGRAFAKVLGNNGHQRRVVLARDTRLSGYMLENAFSAGLLSMGVDVLLSGILPSSGCALITRKLKCDAGVMISASHNPPSDNGLKFFSAEGFKIEDDLETAIESMVLTNKIITPNGSGFGKLEIMEEALEQYVEFVCASWPKDLKLSEMHIILDCANGASFQAAPMIFSNIGAKLTIMGTHPNGININDNCGSLYLSGIQNEIQQRKGQIGIAFDGDADRVAFVDEKGNEVDSDKILGILALDMLKHGELNKKTIAVTVITNSGLDLTLQEAGGQVIRTDVGDRYVIEAMRKNGLNLGGEQSGHMILMDYSPCGDGLLAALKILEIMTRSGKSLSELATQVKSLPQIQTDVHFSRRRELDEIPEFQKALKQSQTILNKSGRLLVRYSGTQPLCRIMAEGEDLIKLEYVVGLLSHTLTSALK
jgi:phosphoglucosamine mutase